MLLEPTPALPALPEPALADPDTTQPVPVVDLELDVDLDVDMASADVAPVDLAPGDMTAVDVADDVAPALALAPASIEPLPDPVPTPSTTPTPAVSLPEPQPLSAPAQVTDEPIFELGNNEALAQVAAPSGAELDANSEESDLETLFWTESEALADLKAKPRSRSGRLLDRVTGVHRRID